MNHTPDSIVSSPRRSSLRMWLPLLLLLPIYGIGCFARVAWTPDEPREMAIIANMSAVGANHYIPQLGKSDFCEKPPLYYWAGAACVQVFGRNEMAARLPNLLSVTAVVVSTALLGEAMMGWLAGFIAACIMGTAVLAVQIGIWSITDGMLLGLTGLALLGAYRGLIAMTTGKKLAWYAFMHVCLGLGILTKNIVILIVPLSAWGCACLFGGRRRELFHLAFHAGWILQGLVVAPWVIGVANSPGGHDLLVKFFFENLLGRFAPTVGGAYSHGHRHWFGKYLIEMPYYLMPWTPLVAIGSWRFWKSRGTSSEGGKSDTLSWWFLLGSVVPPLLIFSLSATKREIYCGPVLIGLAVITGIGIVRTWEVKPRAVTLALRISTLSVCTAALVAALVAIWIPWHFAIGSWTTSVIPATVAILGGIVLGTLALRCITGGDLWAAMCCQIGLLSLTVVSAGWSLVQTANSTQDHRLVASQIVMAVGQRQLALYRPDETTIGMLDFYAGLKPDVIDDETALARYITNHPDVVVLAVSKRRATNEAPSALDQPPFSQVCQVTLPLGRIYSLYSPQRN